MTEPEKQDTPEADATETLPSDYRSRARYPILAVSLSTMGLILIKTGRDAVFFQENGLQQLPAAYLWTAIAASLGAMVHLQAINRWGARKSRVGVFFLAAAFFILFSPFVHPEARLLMTILFVATPVIFAALFAAGWLLAGDILEGADSNSMGWAYSRIGAGSMIGGVLGGVWARGLAIWFSPAILIACGAGVLLAVGILVYGAHRRYPADQFTTSSPARDISGPKSPMGILFVHSNLIRNPYIFTMSTIGAMAALAGLFIDFQFYAAAFITGNNNAQFFANFYIVLNAASLILQLSIAPRLQSKLGVAGVLMVTPFVLLGGASAVTFVLWLSSTYRLRNLGCSGIQAVDPVVRAPDT